MRTLKRSVFEKKTRASQFWHGDCILFLLLEVGPRPIPGMTFPSFPFLEIPAVMVIAVGITSEEVRPSRK